MFYIIPLTKYFFADYTKPEICQNSKQISTLVDYLKNRF